VVSDVLGAWQGIAVLVLLDEHRQPTQPELLVSCTPDASLPIDVHVGANHPDEQTSGTRFAHFAAFTFPSVALLRRRLPQPFPDHDLHTVERSNFAPVAELRSLASVACLAWALTCSAGPTPAANASMIEAESLIMIYCIVINEQLSSTLQGEQNAKSSETND
jgi:hypothetical protein